MGDFMKTINQRQLDIKLLAETSKSLNEANDFQAISQIIFKFVQNFITYNLIVIYKMNEKDNSLDIVSSLGSNTEKMKRRIPFKVGEGVVGNAAKDKKSILIDDAFRSKQIKVRQYHDEDPLIRSFMAVPLVVGDKVIGILSISSSKPYQYTEYDMQMISIITSQGASLLELNANLAEVEQFSDQILENINSGVIVTNADFEILIFNDASEKLTGYSASEVVGKKLVNIPIKEKDNHWYIINSIKLKKIYDEEKAYMITKSGKKVDISLSTSLIYNDDNSVKTCICIFRDITEIEKLQRQVILTDKLAALGRLTAGITHEIRNPLLPIKSASQLLLDKYRVDDEAIKLLKIIIEESERLNRFLGKLSNLSKESVLTNGKSNFNLVLDDTLTLLKYNLNSSNIKLSIDIMDEDIIILCNEDNLKQVLLNTILNAIDAINTNGINSRRKISIEGLLQNNYFILDIIDSGKGISDEEISNIFDPFYTTKDSGTGLGLPLSLNIINNIGGRILIESSINVGTKVTLIIPTLTERML